MNLNFIPHHLEIKIIIYELELTPKGKKIDFNLMDDSDFTTPYILDTIPKSPEVQQLPTQSKNNFWVISVYGEEPITTKGSIEKLKYYHYQHEKSKVKISFCRINIY